MKKNKETAGDPKHAEADSHSLHLPKTEVCLGNFLLESDFDSLRRNYIVLLKSSINKMVLGYIYVCVCECVGVCLRSYCGWEGVECLSVVCYYYWSIVPLFLFLLFLLLLSC